MDEKSRIQAATILQGIVKGYMNPVRHMSADDENYEKWMRLVERMDQEYAKDPFFEQVMVSLTAEGYLPGGEAGLGYKPARNLLDQWQIEDVIQEFYNSILERKVNGIRYSLKGFWDKSIPSGVLPGGMMALASVFTLAFSFFSFFVILALRMTSAEDPQ